MKRVAHPVELSLDQCIKCNICTTGCPVAAVTDLFPGPKYEAPQAGRFRALGRQVVDLSVDYCSGCRVCNMICPTGVKIAEINARARAGMVKDGRFPLRRRLRNNLIARADLIGKLGQPIHQVTNFILNFKTSRLLAEYALEIHHEAPLPKLADSKFTTWFRHHQPSGNPGRKVAYFHGCSTQYYEPRVGRAAVRVLEALGCEVIIPKQNCCGLPLLSNGEFAAARRYHASNVRSLVELARQGIPIVGTSTSCTLTLKEEAPELLDMWDEDTQLVARMVFDFNEFLLSDLFPALKRYPLKSIPLQLGYHIPCQYRAHRLGKPGLEVLKLVPDLQVVDSQADCCGIAGTYGYKKEKYDIAMQVGQPLFDFAKQIQAPAVICDSETCRWQITHATGLPAVHPVEILAAAMGFEPEVPLAALLNKV